jgi:hypothetical protein
LLYGIITYRLFDNKEDYLILFKGGRALQLSLNDIPNVTKYFSEDTDVLIIPNKFQIFFIISPENKINFAFSNLF